MPAGAWLYEKHVARLARVALAARGRLKVQNNPPPPLPPHVMIPLIAWLLTQLPFETHRQQMCRLQHEGFTVSPGYCPRLHCSLLAGGSWARRQPACPCESCQGLEPANSQHATQLLRALHSRAHLQAATNCLAVTRQGYGASLVAMQMLAWLLLEPGYSDVNFPSSSSLLPFSRPVPCKEWAGVPDTCTSRRLPGLAQHRAGVQHSMQTIRSLCS